MINTEGDTLLKGHIEEEGSLYRDCLGNLHVVGKDKTWQIYIEEKKLYLLYPVSSQGFIEQLNPFFQTCVRSAGKNQRHHIYFQLCGK
jgi:hypothetical protein